MKKHPLHLAVGGSSLEVAKFLCENAFDANTANTKLEGIDTRNMNMLLKTEDGFLFTSKSRESYLRFRSALIMR